ncbi:MAG: hypothetical protein Q7W02_08330 [Candidatus Rokubacteria bacterium]|nr:hypothetical protein [Candidatus Rokubacteria bacterium]
MPAELTEWAREIGERYQEIALVLLMQPPERAGSLDTVHVCLVMKDGKKEPWFATGKGIEGLAYATVPGRQARERILTDERLRVPGLQLYMNFCDPRALMFTYRDGEERLAGEEIADFRYRILYPSADQIPPLEEFFHLWGDAVVVPDSVRAPGKA